MLNVTLAAKKPHPPEVRVTANRPLSALNSDRTGSVTTIDRLAL